MKRPDLDILKLFRWIKVSSTELSHEGNIYAFIFLSDIIPFYGDEGV